MTKAALRDAMRQRRAQVDAAARAAASEAVTIALLARPELAAAAEVACFLSLPQEIDTSAFVAACHRLGKRVCVPAWSPARGDYFFARLVPETALVPGPLGVSEPAAATPVKPETIDFAVVPGLAFDRRGGRIGHGGGHFDRLLAGCGPVCCKVGIGYAWQVVAGDLPQTARDVRMDLVVTDGEVVVVGL